MKKIKLMAFAAMAAFALAACTPSTESLVSQYEKACKAGDVEQIEKLANQLEERGEELTEEQQVRILSASFEAAGVMLNAAGMSMEDVLGDEAELSDEEFQAALDEALEGYEE